MMLNGVNILFASDYLEEQISLEASSERRIWMSVSALLSSTLSVYNLWHHPRLWVIDYRWHSFKKPWTFCQKNVCFDHIIIDHYKWQIYLHVHL